MSENSSFFLHNAGLGFGSYGPEDELLHPQMNAQITDEALTETQYFGFNVPEERIHALTYFWHHPRLNTFTGGAMVWQGIKNHHLACELYDLRLFMSDKVIGENIDHYRIPSSYQVDVIDPFKQVRLRYEDKARQNAFDIHCTAIAPPAMLPNRKHFEQPMRTTGSLTLRGKTYKVDGVNVRDRSWAEARSEAPVPFPPVAWLTGVFSDDFAFNCSCTDDPTRSPDWQGIYDIPASQALKGGWIYQKGTYTRVVEASKLTRRDPVTLRPVSHELEVVDEKGQRFSFTGQIEASSPCGYWSNVSIFIALVKWTCNGQTGYGDSQEAQWTDYVHARLSG
ncbi:MAG: hypothetical protein ABW034_08960, partial [Steroidobacteraceae bacterium]